MVTLNSSSTHFKRLKKKETLYIELDDTPPPWWQVPRKHISVDKDKRGTFPYVFTFFIF